MNLLFHIIFSIFKGLLLARIYKSKSAIKRRGSVKRRKLRKIRKKINNKVQIENHMRSLINNLKHTKYYERKFVCEDQ
jgi:hypothetical protein